MATPAPAAPWMLGTSPSMTKRRRGTLPPAFPAPRIAYPPSPPYNLAAMADSGRAFVKMHGLGNDFVIVDARREAFAPDAELARRIADRHRGVGFDQLITIEPPADGGLARLRFLNSDGSESAACGNGTRCVAWLLAEESGESAFGLETNVGLLDCRREGALEMTVDLGPARQGWREIPLAREMDTLHLDLALGPLSDPAAVSVGNPHATFFVDDVDAVDIESLGPRLEHDPLFPERANVAVASLLGPDRLRVRVWERGAGITQACGTGASAAAVNAARRGLTGRRVETRLDGGRLTVEWRADGHVLMSGPVSLSFEGRLSAALLAGAEA